MYVISCHLPNGDGPDLYPVLFKDSSVEVVGKSADCEDKTGKGLSVVQGAG